MTEKQAQMAKKNQSAYSDFRGRTAYLTDAEKDYFRQTVSRVLSILNYDIPVYMCDHERFDGKAGDALGMHWKNAQGDEFITIDNYFIHECFDVEFNGAYNIDGETLVSVLCHELAHVRYQRHTKYHAELTELYISKVKEEE